jgi:flagellar biosynthesis component FlhA
LAVPPDRQAEFALKTKRQIETAASGAGGAPVVVICSPQVRLWARRLIEPVLPQTPVLALNEIVRGIDVQAHGVVSLDFQRANIPSPVHA